MIALLLIASLGQDMAIHGRVIDRSTTAPVPAALVWSSHSRVVTDAEGRFTLLAAVGDTLRARRIGFRPGLAVVDDSFVTVLLAPAAATLAGVDVHADVAPPRHGAAVDLDALRRGGAVTLGEGIARLPLVSPRSARGGMTVSMRGSRSEQVLVLLDGVPLNDPATGTAELSDIPLVALGGAVALPGAAGAAHGSGGSGGVVALSSGRGSVATVHGGSFGRAGAGLALGGVLGGAVVRAGGEWSYAQNDFPYVNTEGGGARERRANNDERRAALFGSVTHSSAQLTVLASRSERGLVGRVNVSAFDQARGETHRLLVGAAANPGGWHARASLQLLDASYRDPRVAFGSTSVSADGALGRDVLGARVRVGGGIDRARGTALADTTRPRAFAAVERRAQRGAWTASAAARLDAIRNAGVNVSPDLALERRGAVTVFARAAQSFRAPAFQDLYLASRWVEPDRLLSPERVVWDVELGARAGRGGLAVSAAAFERRTHNSIVWFESGLGFSPANAGREVVRGVEARVVASAGPIAIDLWGAARTTRLRLDRDRVNVRTPYVPYADGGARATVDAGAVAFAAVATALGRRPYAAVSGSARDAELPAVVVLDLEAGWRGSIRSVDASISLAARNATDVQWQSLVLFPSAGRGWLASFTLSP